jgi:hypothetical protein
MSTIYKGCFSVTEAKAALIAADTLFFSVTEAVGGEVSSFAY